MPLVRIDLPADTTAQHITAVSEAVHQAMVSTFNVPADDRFQILAHHAVGELVCTPEFLGVRHGGHVVFIQIACAPGRTHDMKRALYATIAREVAATTRFDADDVIINLVETARENWSFGQGVAQYAPVDR